MTGKVDESSNLHTITLVQPRIRFVFRNCYQILAIHRNQTHIQEKLRLGFTAQAL
jgi:hypothetical protein